MHVRLIVLVALFVCRLIFWLFESAEIVSLLALSLSFLCLVSVFFFLSPRLSYSVFGMFIDARWLRVTSNDFYYDCTFLQKMNKIKMKEKKSAICSCLCVSFVYLSFSSSVIPPCVSVSLALTSLFLSLALYVSVYFIPVIYCTFDTLAYFFCFFFLVLGALKLQC